MHADVFIGIQATGKSTFFQQRFFATHVRINLDMLKTCISDDWQFIVMERNDEI